MSQGKITSKQKEILEYIKETILKKGYLMGICDPDLIAQVQIRQAVMEDKQIGKLVERLRRSGCEICVTETYIEIPEEGGASQKYDIYCCVYRKDDPDMPIHTVGFSVN